MENKHFTDELIDSISKLDEISEKDRKIIDCYTANRIAGLLFLYLAHDTKRINDIVNKYNIPDGIISEILPEIEGYIEK